MHYIHPDFETDVMEVAFPRVRNDVAVSRRVSCDVHDVLRAQLRLQAVQMLDEMRYVSQDDLGVGL